VKRVWRWLINGLAALSLTLCLATAALWLFSYKFPSTISGDFFHDHLCVGDYFLGIYGGEAVAGYERYDNPIDLKYARAFRFRRAPDGFNEPVHGFHSISFFDQVWVDGDDRRSQDDDFPWFSEGRGIFKTNTTGRSFSAPIYSLTLASAFLPAVLIPLRIHRKRTHREGHCRNCGYDLRATPEKCPECGTIPKRKDVVSS
jgi:hypothetical protein